MHCYFELIEIPVFWSNKVNILFKISDINSKFLNKKQSELTVRIQTENFFNKISN